MAYFPALHTRTMSLPDIARQSAALKGQQLRNRIAEAELGQIEAQGQRNARIDRLMPAAIGGDETARTQASALNPKLIEVFAKMDERERERLKAHANVFGRLAEAAYGASPLQRAQIHQQATAYAEQNGMGESVANWPQPNDPGYDAWLVQKMAEMGDVSAAIEEAETAPSGYRYTDGQDLEAIPGGPADPDQAKKLAAAKRAPKKPEPPKTVGGLQWNAETKSWEEIPGYIRNQAALAAAKDTKRGKSELTVPQQRDNEAIDVARKVLDAMRYGKDELMRRLQKTTDTGRDNPDYDPMLETVVNRALRRKYGEDPEFDKLYRKYMGEAEPPIPGMQRGEDFEPLFDNRPKRAAKKADRNIAAMSRDDIAALINGPEAEKLTEAERQQISDRLDALDSGQP